MAIDLLNTIEASRKESDCSPPFRQTGQNGWEYCFVSISPLPVIPARFRNTVRPCLCIIGGIAPFFH